MTHEELEFRRENLLELLAAEHPTTLKVAAAIPDDKLGWKPAGEKGMTAAELALHIAGASNWFLALASTGAPPAGNPPPTPDFPNSDALCAVMRSLFDGYEEHVRRAPPAMLGAITSFMGSDYENVRILTWHVYHMIHHRGQLTTYLRVMGAKVPSTYGPSGDEDLAG